jgi:hypothetical protein
MKQIKTKGTNHQKIFIDDSTLATIVLDKVS